uniref:Uncharacterized protein n=1 Tax=Anguilla anguilla TaxID=7936 RepID=A0A0E9QD35_ANGAN
MNDALMEKETKKTILEEMTHN